MKGFNIVINGKKIDYLKGKKINEKELINYFNNLGCQNISLIKDNNLFNRHLLLTGFLNKIKIFIKIATSSGISYINENEVIWYQLVNKKVNVPKIYKYGYFKKNFYFISEYLPQNFININYLKNNIDSIIKLAEKISNLKIKKLPADDYNPGSTHNEKFIFKVNAHFESLPKKIIYKYRLDLLMAEIKKNYINLKQRCRHGDFNINHMILKNKKIYLIDGQLAMTQWVEYYDIGYLIQRIYSQHKNPNLAYEIYKKLIAKGYNKNKLKTILLARAIGGFLDEYISLNKDYSIHKDFKNWILNL